MMDPNIVLSSCVLNAPSSSVVGKDTDIEEASQGLKVETISKYFELLEDGPICPLVGPLMGHTCF